MTEYETDKSTSRVPRTLRDAFGCSVKASINTAPCKVRTVIIDVLQVVAIITVILASIAGITYLGHLELSTAHTTPQAKGAQ